MDTTIHSALPADHPWLVKPETGAYFICVKSYSRPAKPKPGDEGLSARELAEALATDIRDNHRVYAYLFEYISEERKAEMAAIAAARERARIFASQLDKYRQDAQLKGMVFMEEDRITVHHKSVNYNDQIAVLVGGFKTDEDARKALDKVHTWPSPKNKMLMDGAAIVATGKDGKPGVQEGYMNPYMTATIVPNPSIPRQQAASSEATIDPIITKLNHNRPYSLLKATKGWTLAVKSFTAPVEIVGRDGDGKSAMKKIGTSSGGDVLQAGAVQAEALAKALREMKGPGGQVLGLESFVLHTRTSSIVTVGQFDSPNDPALIQTQQLLKGITMNVSDDKTGTRPSMNTLSLFENKLLPMPIPRAERTQ
jgi:hypothetical protein